MYSFIKATSVTTGEMLFNKKKGKKKERGKRKGGKEKRLFFF